MSKKVATILIAVVLVLAVAGAIVAGVLLSKKFTVTFEADGQVVDLKKVSKGKTVSPPTVSSIDKEFEQLQFSYWTTSDSSNPIDFSKFQITGDTTFRAVFTSVPLYTASFDLGFAYPDGTYSSQTLAAGTKLSNIPEPIRNGFVFDGWYEDSNFSSYIDDLENVEINTNTKIYAKWRKIHKVEFKNYDGVVVATQNVVDSSFATTPSKEPSRPETETYIYQFYGWKLADIESTPKISEYPITGDTVFVAKYTQKAKKVTVTFMLEGEEYRKHIVDTGTKVPKPDNPSKAEHTFSGWFFANGVFFDFNEPVTQAQDISLEARFKINRYTLTLDYNYGTVPVKTITSDYNTLWQAPQMTRAGFAFQGWFKTKNEDGSLENEFAFDGTQNLAKSESQITIYAKWEIINYSIEYSIANGLKEGHLEGVENPNTVSNYTITSDNINITNASREGYTFSGWYTTENFVSTSKITKIETGSTGNLTLYAKWLIKAYSVKFITNIEGGPGLPDKVVQYDSLVEKPSNPIKTGYNFVNWMTEQDGDVAFDFVNTKITKNITLYAKWQKKQYNLTIQLDGGSHTTFTENYIITKEYQEAWKANIPTYSDRPTKEHYEFNKWVIPAESSKTFDFENAIATSNLTIKASYTRKIYELTFITEIENEIPKASAPYESRWGEPSQIPVKEGHNFDKWYEDASRTIAFNFQTKIATDNLNVYAGWIPIKYNLTLNANGGKFIISETKVIKADFGTPWTLDSFDPPTKKGHSVVNWYLERDPFVNIYDWDTLAKEANERIIYAMWQKNTYDISYYITGNEVEPIPYRTGETAVGYEEPLSAHLPSVTYDDHIFNGWDYLNPANSTYEALDLAYMPDFDLILRAKWTKTQYTLTITLQNDEYLDGYTSGTQTQITKDFDQIWAEVAPTPQKAHYDFQGWLDASDTAFDFTKTAKTTGSKTIHASWAPSVYTLTLNNTFDSANYPKVEEVSYGNTWESKKPIDPEADGYNFIGWRKAGYSVNFDFTTAATENITLQAQWEPRVYNITWNRYTLGDESHPITHQGAKNTYKITDATYNFTNPSRVGYQFLGWYDNGTFSGDAIISLPEGSYGHKEYFAKWQINTYNLTLKHSNESGTLIDTLTANYDSSWTKPSDPSHYQHPSHYTFDNWYNQKSGQGGIFNFATKATAHKEIFANFDIKQYTLTFNSDGGSTVSPQTKNALSTWTKPTDPTKTTGEGDSQLEYELVHWYVVPTEGSPDEDTAFAFGQATESVDLKAKWKVKQYTLKVNLLGGSHELDPNKNGYFNITVDMKKPWNYGQASWVDNKPSNASRDGYTFEGYFADLEGLNEFDFTTLATSNLEIYTKWSIITYNITYDNIPAEAVTGRFAETYTVETPTIDLSKYYWQMNRLLNDSGTIEYVHDIDQWKVTDAEGEVITRITKGSIGHLTLWATWKEHEWMITYNLNGGSNHQDNLDSFKNSEHEESQHITLNNPTKAHYEFASWHTDYSLSDDSKVPVEGLDGKQRNNYNLYAKWTPIEYNITYVLPEGATNIVYPSITTYSLESPTIDLEKAYWQIGGEFFQTKDWYNIENHNENPAYKVTVINPNPDTIGNITLYATSETRTYQVTFDTMLEPEEEGTPIFFSNPVEHGATVASPEEDPIRQGYTFAGWYKEPGHTNLWDFALDTVTSDITLYAKWT